MEYFLHIGAFFIYTNIYECATIKILSKGGRVHEKT